MSFQPDQSSAGYPCSSCAMVAPICRLNINNRGVMSYSVRKMSFFSLLNSIFMLVLCIVSGRILLMKFIGFTAGQNMCCFFHPSVCIAVSGTMEASQQGRRLYLSSSWFPLHLPIKVHSIFSYRVLSDLQLRRLSRDCHAKTDFNRKIY